jgi:glycosyltransferase involved in cell wall biosynthesis
MAARGHEVTVLTHQPHMTARHENVRGVSIVRVPSLRSRYLFTFLAGVGALRRATHADLVHTTTYNAAPPAWLAARLSGTPVLLTVNEIWIGRWSANTNFSASKAALHEWLERLVFSLRYDRYVCISQATAERLREVLPASQGYAETIYYGFDRTPWATAEKSEHVRAALGLTGAFLIVGYGRPGASKGFEYLVQAFEQIRTAIPNAALLLILSTARQHAQDLAKLKQLAGPRVFFLPPQPFAELPAYVKNADCVVVPSIAEGFGYTTVESVAAGVPVVASNVGSIPEVIGGRYKLVAPRDAAAISAAVIDVAAGRYDTAPEKHFSWYETILRYEAAYRETIRQHRQH